MATQGDMGKSDKDEVSPWWRDLIESARTYGCEEDEDRLVKQLLRDPTGNYRTQALLRASCDGNAEGVEVMLTLGARVNAYSKIGITSLHAAAAEGHTNIVNILIAHGADARAVSSAPAALLAGTHAVLCQRSADMRLQPEGGVTPLMLAAGNGHLNVVKVLLSCGADVGAKDSDGRRAVAYASIRGHKDVVRALVSHQPASTSTSSTAEDGQGPVKRASSKGGAAGGAPDDADLGDVDCALVMLVEAVCAGDEAKVDEVLRSWPELDVNALLESETALMRAVCAGHVRVVRMLLVEYHADPNVICTEGNRCTCLMMAADKGDVELVHLLLQHGANVHAKDDYGCTAIIHAVSSAGVVAFRSLELLKKHGADLTATCDKGVTALMMAAYGGSMEVVRYLLANGADPTAKDQRGRDAVAWAKSRRASSEVVTVLSEAVKAHVESLAARVQGLGRGEAQTCKDKSSKSKKKHRRKGRKGEGAALASGAQAGRGLGAVDVSVDAAHVGVDRVPCGDEEQQLQQVTAAVAVSSLHGGEVEPAAEEAEAQGSVTVLVPVEREAPPVELTEEDFDDAPTLFECPISHTIMRDPVTAQDGYCYERLHIETWIRKAAEEGVQPRSPMTNEPMNPLLAPTRVLKCLIDEYMERKLVEKKTRLAAAAQA